MKEVFESIRTRQKTIELKKGKNKVKNLFSLFGS